MNVYLIKIIKNYIRIVDFIIDLFVIVDFFVYRYCVIFISFYMNQEQYVYYSFDNFKKKNMLIYNKNL